MCEILAVSRSGYYKWIDRKPSARETRREWLKKQIRGIFQRSEQIYGSPRIAAVLRDEGHVVSSRTVGRLMKEMGLKSSS